MPCIHLISFESRILPWHRPLLLVLLQGSHWRGATVGIPPVFQPPDGVSAPNGHLARTALSGMAPRSPTPSDWPPAAPPGLGQEDPRREQGACHLLEGSGREQEGPLKSPGRNSLCSACKGRGPPWPLGCLGHSDLDPLRGWASSWLVKTNSFKCSVHCSSRRLLSSWKPLRGNHRAPCTW